MSMCLFNFPFSPNESPHAAHMWTFSPVWVIMCALKCPAWLNDFLHSGQEWGLTPLWVSMCVLRYWTRLKDLLQWTQVYVLSLLWVTIWIFKFPAWPNDLSHSKQMCIFSPLWVSICTANMLWEVIDLEHCVHWCLFVILTWMILTFQRSWTNWRRCFCSKREVHRHFSFFLKIFFFIRCSIWYDMIFTKMTEISWLCYKAIIVLLSPFLDWPLCVHWTFLDNFWLLCNCSEWSGSIKTGPG